MPSSFSSDSARKLIQEYYVNKVDTVSQIKTDDAKPTEPTEQLDGLKLDEKKPQRPPPVYARKPEQQNE
ncbi:hypothetical protein PMIN01_03178 [Paraphaeosphaeria minitans]|uniref:Uncharacterized protein n=1 Tax=Paraphaeosphaeria minitans TaxID=565426 RepID=A0A9P6GMW0_9PLEO|nr:hypothetical protein PMIN01_03178 [Paraphaeosphaeria minitans]